MAVFGAIDLLFQDVNKLFLCKSFQSGNADFTHLCSCCTRNIFAFSLLDSSLYLGEIAHDSVGSVLLIQY